ncbi:MAG: phospholipase D-like domain-containing protein [Deferribacterota bacterium]|nr:phospholipase D-like domain-containing protein [Deferribacterota bacterium]
MKVYFGGPDKPPFYLRNILAEKIDLIGKKGEIFWVTYYFRDLDLANKLIKAAERGANVTVVLERRPRVKDCNDEVFNLLKESSKVKIKYIEHSKPHRGIFGGMPRIHEKVYYFKNDFETSVFIGSFNPSSKINNDDKRIIDLIGDQYRGHNFLVEIDEKHLIEGLYNHCKNIVQINHGIIENFKKKDKCICDTDTKIHFFPWAGKKCVTDFFYAAEKGDRVYIAVSHISLFGIARILYKLKRKGVRLDIISHDTERRFPERIERQLKKYSINYMRYIHPKRYPMHNKFIIIEKKNEQFVGFGSLNLSNRSIYENHEIFAVTNNDTMVEAFKKRWYEIYYEIINNKYS